MSSRHPAAARPGRCAIARAAACLCLALGGGAQAQIATDASLGSAARTLSGPAYVIPQTLGKLSGANLFHSFQTFNIGSGESATFTTATPGIANVISRVTGGSLSQINGLLRLAAADGQPGFFFINPAGITFGAGAAIDVPGAFHVGTADYLAFADGRFHADVNKGSSFSAAAPEAFGFLGSQRAAVVLKEGATVLGRRGQALSLVAGDLSVDNAVIASGSGSIRLAAVGRDVIEVGLQGPLPAASGDLSLRQGAEIFSVAVGQLDGAPVALSAGRIEIGSRAGIYSEVAAEAGGQGGAIDIAARNSLVVSDEGYTWSRTFGSGEAGAIRIRAGEVRLDTGGYLFSSTAQGSTGRAGLIDLAVPGGLQLTSGANISTFTQGPGGGQGIRLKAGTLSIAQDAYVRADAAGSGASGDIVVEVAGLLSMNTLGHVDARSVSDADAGAIFVTAGGLQMDSGSYIESRSSPDTLARSGRIDIGVASLASLAGGAVIQSRSASAGDAGGVRLGAVDLRLDKASINSNALGVTGASGPVDIVLSGSLNLLNASAINTSTLSSGPAGTVSLKARDITLDGGSDITSSALDGSGDAGTIDLRASGRLWLKDGASLSTSTATAGNGGSIQVSADSALLEAGSFITSLANVGSSGRGGNVAIQTRGSLELLQGSSINSIAAGSGKAGNVQVRAGSVALDGLSNVLTVAAIGSSGDAGDIEVVSVGELSLRNQAFISSDTFGQGNAGMISLRAGDVRLGSAAYVTSAAIQGSLGRAGKVVVQADGDLAVQGGAGIQSSTDGPGDAGSVELEAARVLVEGQGSAISAAARANSSGQVGSVQVRARESIAVVDFGTIATVNQASVTDAAPRQPTTLRLTAPEIVLRDGLVRTDSFGNVAASDIVVEAGRGLSLTRSLISTSANDGNGGAVRAATGGLLLLRDSLIQTSVFGRQGNGGDIEVGAGTLLLDTGFIQANTAAGAAAGGLVRIAAGALVASGNSLFLGGDTAYAPRAGVFGFNVIQAAAPTGVSGVVRLDSPVLDVTGSLRELRGEPVDAGGLGRSPCQSSGGSALALAGRGGLPPSARGLLRAEPPSAPRPVVLRAPVPFDAPGVGSTAALAVLSVGSCR